MAVLQTLLSIVPFGNLALNAVNTGMNVVELKQLDNIRHEQVLLIDKVKKLEDRSLTPNDVQNIVDYNLRQFSNENDKRFASVHDKLDRILEVKAPVPQQPQATAVVLPAPQPQAQQAPAPQPQAQQVPVQPSPAPQPQTQQAPAPQNTVVVTPAQPAPAQQIDMTAFANVIRDAINDSVAKALTSQQPQQPTQPAQTQQQQTGSKK